ncbi:hypothetical protein OAF58_00575 [bacterium]|jgi:hypothetical protein|nr:hypothetical protein [bacterium]
MSIPSSSLSDFIALSEILTGFSEFKLNGTGQTERYYATVSNIVGEATMSELLSTYTALIDTSGDDTALIDKKLRADILSSEKLGPIARNLIKLWYIGTWYKLPDAWHAQFESASEDHDFVPHPNSYVEGLLWPAIGAHPPGAKAPGYGTWTDAPNIPAT